MTGHSDPEGILTVTVTPFGDDGAVDFAVFERLLEFLLENGVHCLIPCGSTGEFYALSLDERREVLEFVAERAGDKVPIHAGVNSTHQAEIIELGLIARDLGYQGLLIAAPPYSLPDAAEMAAHFKALDEALEMPIMLYNFPARTGVHMDNAFLDGVLDVANIASIKESSGDLDRLHQVVVRYQGRIAPVCGADDQALEYFLWGARSWVAGASNFLPAEHVALWEACVQRRDFEAGLAIMRRLLPLFMEMEGGKYIQCCKYGCQLAGIPVGDPRPPLQPLDDDEKRRFRTLYEAALGAG